MPPPVGPCRDDLDAFFEIRMACGILGTPDDGMSLPGNLARVLGQPTFPDPMLLARTSEEEFKQAITDLGVY
eukprot:11094257-Alexandrium_andersonii.AAC.1